MVVGGGGAATAGSAPRPDGLLVAPEGRAIAVEGLRLRRCTRHSRFAIRGSRRAPPPRPRCKGPCRTLQNVAKIFRVGFCLRGRGRVYGAFSRVCGAGPFTIYDLPFAIYRACAGRDAASRRSRMPERRAERAWPLALPVAQRSRWARRVSSSRRSSAAILAYHAR